MLNIINLNIKKPLETIATVPKNEMYDCFALTKSKVYFLDSKRTIDI